MGIYRSDGGFAGRRRPHTARMVIVHDEFTGLSLGDGCFPAVPASVLASNHSIGRDLRPVKSFCVGLFQSLLLAFLLPRLPRRFEAGIALFLNLLVLPGQPGGGRHVADRAVQAHVVVLVHPPATSR